VLILGDPSGTFLHVGAPQTANNCIHFKPHALQVQMSNAYIAAIKLGSALAVDSHQVLPPCVA